jgi:hypothetical protein
MMFPKQTYIRSQKLLKLVASLPCQCCGMDNGVQAAHSNWAEWGGKGKSLKSSDEYVAALCLKCHYTIDQGAHLTKEERKEMWLKAHQRTVDNLVENNQWPKEIPIPIY